MHQFIIIHRPHAEPWSWSEANHDWLLWSTCMRQLAFHWGPKQDLQFLNLNSDLDQIFFDQEAYRLLLSIVCGLHSPVVGETEVFGQFKLFVEHLESQIKSPTRDENTASAINSSDISTQLLQHQVHEVLPWLRQAVIDVKNIRHHHLKDMGGQSYGSLIRKEIKNAKKIQIIGAGHLVQEILPWLTKTQLPLSLHVRNPKNIKITLPESLQVFPLEKPMDWEGIVILAAPLRSTDFSRIMKIKNNFLTSRKSPCKVMDLRGTCETDPLEKSWTIVDLKMLTNHLQSNEVRMNLLKEDVNHEILVKSEKLWMKAKLRPHGWEDICA